MIVKTVITKPIKQRISYRLVKNQQVLVMTLGDIHFGIRDFDAKRLKTFVRWGLDRGAYFIGTGDYVDFTSETQRKVVASIREDAREFLDSMVLLKAQELFKILEPSVGRWLGMIEGNHRWDFDSMELSGTSVDQYLCGLLKCDFFGTSGLLRIHSEKSPENHPEADCTVYFHHGIGSSRTQGGQLHRVEDLLKWIGADIYLMGHSHAKLAAPIDCQFVSPDGKHYHRTKFIARTGGFYRGYVSHEPLGLEEPVVLSRGSYIEQKAYAPSALGGLCFGIGYEKIYDSEYYRPTIHVSI